MPEDQDRYVDLRSKIGQPTQITVATDTKIEAVEKQVAELRQQAAALVERVVRPANNFVNRIMSDI